MHIQYMHNSKEDKEAVIDRANALIAEGRFDQRRLAREISVSQGHLSKMLSGYIGVNSKAMRRLTALIEAPNEDEYFQRDEDAIAILERGATRSVELRQLLEALAHFVKMHIHRAH
jgi:DNA transposition AAA+ family ATPase